MREALCVLMLWCGVVSSSFASDDKLPHYFPDGIENITVPALQWEAYARYFNATANLQPGRGAAPATDVRSIKLTRKIAGKKVKIVFGPWKRTDDNQIVFYYFGGQKYVSEVEFEFVVQDFVKQSERAVDKLYNYYKGLKKDVVKILADQEKKSEEEMDLWLDQPVPESPSITFRELLQLPRKLKKSDFVPYNEIHFGYGRYLGAAWLNSGLVYITLQARIADELIGQPSVVMHEYIHSNPILQNFPLSEAIDLELMASVPMMLLPEDKIHLPFHGYMRDVREIFHVFLGFDFEQARKEIFLDLDGFNQRINVEKFNEYYGKLEKGKKEFLPFFREEVLPKYYVEQIFWTSLNEKLVDTRGIFRIMMALNYDLTILGGREKTMKWLETNKPKIGRMAHKAFEASGGPRKEDKKGNIQAAISFIASFTGIDQKELLRLAEKYDVREADIKGKSFAELMELFLSIMDREQHQLEEVTK